MVLDPLSALSLAGCIVQFIEFSTKLISTSHLLHTSTTGALVEHLELEAITNHLVELNGKIRSSRPADDPDQPLSKDEGKIKDLCENCDAVASQLLATLNKLKVQGHNNKWTSFNQALRTVWSSEKINTLRKRLLGYRAQLDTMMLMSLR